MRIDDNMLLGQHKIISTKVVDLKDIELHDLPGYGSRYIKTKIRTYGDKVYSNFRCLNVPEEGVECKSFTVICFDFLFVYENDGYLQVYYNKCTTMELI